MIGSCGFVIWSKTLMELIFNLCSEFQLSLEAQLATLGPLGSFQIFKGLFRCSRESGVQKATRRNCTYSSLVKLQPWFVSLQWKNCSLGSCTCSKGPALGQNTLMISQSVQSFLSYVHIAKGTGK